MFHLDGMVTFFPLCLLERDLDFHVATAAIVALLKHAVFMMAVVVCLAVLK